MQSHRPSSHKRSPPSSTNGRSCRQPKRQRSSSATSWPSDSGSQRRAAQPWQLSRRRLVQQPSEPGSRSRLLQPERMSVSSDVQLGASHSASRLSQPESSTSRSRARPPMLSGRRTRARQKVRSSSTRLCSRPRPSGNAVRVIRRESSTVCGSASNCSRSRTPSSCEPPRYSSSAHAILSLAGRPLCLSIATACRASSASSSAGRADAAASTPRMRNIGGSAYDVCSLIITGVCSATAKCASSLQKSTVQSSKRHLSAEEARRMRSGTSAAGTSRKSPFEWIIKPDGFRPPRLSGSLAYAGSLRLHPSAVCSKRRPTIGWRVCLQKQCWCSLASRAPRASSTAWSHAVWSRWWRW
mmetsp:Transcript_35206/g.105206  ORF Transcript_35206/g.105206 Transcript_35206/m.105206 type:complete len:355 (+) Transcript_35206:665-1729(+)